MPFAQRNPLPRPEAGQTLFAGREQELGLYRLHFHRPQDDPEVRLITTISGPGGVGKTRLLDELEWYRPAETVWCPHPATSAGVWGRKPMPGLGVALIERHGLDRERSLMVGDLDSDRGFADQLGMPYRDAERFFAGGDPSDEVMGRP